MKLKKMIFKDRCDGCRQPRVCRGNQGKVLCEECIKKMK